MKGESDHEKLVLKLHDFCVNCGDNMFMEFVWVQTVKRLQPCDDNKAKTIIDELKKDKILIVDGRKLFLNKNTHRNMKFINA